MKSPGILYVVATPIGNLDDISSRALAVLQAAGLVAAEDTRRTGQLLRHFGIATPLLSLHEHNEEKRSEEILDRLGQGVSIALVSDAGTPLISDPGYRLVALARARGFTVTAIPGCCAAIAALSVAGLPTAQFHFEGFLPARAAARRKRLGELRGRAETLVFYEAVHRVTETLADMAAVFEADRHAFVARELTKLHETTYSGSLGQLCAALAADPNADKGEFTIVVAGRAAASADESELGRIVAVLAAELPAAQAAALAARIAGGSRREAYRLLLAQK